MNKNDNKYGSDKSKTDLFKTVKSIADFRNNFIEHQEKELSDISIAREGLAEWVVGL
jgi:hypothetical protein